MTASMACYMTGVGGMIYCIIRNPHPYGFDQVCVCVCVGAVFDNQ